MRRLIEVKDRAAQIAVIAAGFASSFPAVESAVFFVFDFMVESAVQPAEQLALLPVRSLLSLLFSNLDTADTT